MSSGADELDAIRRRVLELVTENEDVNALMEECLPGKSSAFFSTCLPTTVHGLLSALENQSELTGTSVPVLSASILSEHLKKLISKKNNHLLDASDRSLLSVVVGICNTFLEKNLFSRKHFAKFITKNVVLPMEILWKLESESIMTLDCFITSNLSSPAVIGGIAQNISDLCTVNEGTKEDTVMLRCKIVSDLVLSLVNLTYGTDRPDDATTRGVRKVSSALLDSITKKLLVKVEGLRRDVNLFEGLLSLTEVVDKQILKKYFARQVTVVLSSSAIFKVSDAIKQQNLWTFFVMDKFLRDLLEQLLTVFEFTEALDLVCRLLEQQEVNWRTLLSFVSVLLVCSAEARNQFDKFVVELLRDSMRLMSMDKMIAGMLFGRQACLEGPSVFMTYQDWFQRLFGGGTSSSLCGNKKSFAFLVKFLTDIVPYEPAPYLKAHIQKPPFIPPKCRPLWLDYETIVKTRLLDLKESWDNICTSHDLSADTNAVGISQLECDIDKAVVAFEKSRKVPTSILEASIFKKQYFLGKFLPALLQPRPLPSVPDLRMEFIEALHRAGKIPDSQFLFYKENCKKLTDQLLEGVFDYNSDDDVEDMLLTAEEQLQKSLESYRNCVLQGHSTTKAVTAVSEMLFAARKQEAGDIVVKCPEIVVNMDETNSDQEMIKIAHLLLNYLCQISSDKEGSPYDFSWLTSFLMMLLRHPSVLQSVSAIVCHLLTEQSVSLASHHLPGLVAVIAQLTNLEELSGHIFALDRNGKLVPFVCYVFDSLPMSSSRTLRFSLQFATSFSYCSYMMYEKHKNSKSVHKRILNESLCHTVEIEEEVEQIEVTSVFPEQILHLISYAGPRIFPQLRYDSKRNQFSSNKDQLLNSLMKLNSLELFQLSMNQCKMTFKEWVQNELNIIDDDLSMDECQVYYDWVLFTQRYSLPENYLNCLKVTYMESCCSVLVDEIVDFEMKRKLIKSKHNRHNRTSDGNHTNLYKMSADRGKCNLRHLLQKLVRISISASDIQHQNLWLWETLKRRLKNLEDTKAEERIESDATVYAVCELIYELPPSLLLLNASLHPQHSNNLHPTFDDITWFINCIARNFATDGIAMNSRLTSHVLEALLVTPLACNELIAQVLEQCPLLTSSTVLNWDTLSHLQQMKICGSTFSTFLEELEKTIKNVKDGTLEELGCNLWMKGVVMFSTLKAGHSTLEHLWHFDSGVMAYLHECIMVQITYDLLQGVENVTMLDDIMMIYKSAPKFPGAISRDVGAKVILCVSNTLQRLLPLVHVYVFVLAAERHLLKDLSNWPLNLETVVCNYKDSIKLYESMCKENWTLFNRSAVEILQAASAGIIQLINMMSVKSLQTINQTVFNDTDIQLKAAFIQKITDKL